MARRALKLASFATVAAATTGFYLHSNKQLDPNDFGVVRVGRAVATTAVITYDYLTSLRSVPRGTEEYEYVKSQMKKPLRGRRFDDREDVIFEVEQWFSSKAEDFYKEGLKQVKKRWQKCVTLQGDYVEKN